MARKTEFQPLPAERLSWLQALGLVAALAALLNVGLAFRDAWDIKQKVEQAQDELVRARDRNDRIRKQIQALQTNPAAVDRGMRVQNQLQPGEEIVRPR